MGDKPGYYEAPVYAARMKITGAADQGHVHRNVSCQQALHTEKKKLCSFGCCIQTGLKSQTRKCWLSVPWLSLTEPGWSLCACLLLDDFIGLTPTGKYSKDQPDDCIQEAIWPLILPFGAHLSFP